MHRWRTVLNRVCGMALVLCGLMPMSPATGTAHPMVFFEGSVQRGETFRHEFLNFTFYLAPIPHGWQIVVRQKGRPRENLARLTPPYHFVPNPRYIEGWHFRNADNTGPNEAGEKNVNAPQEQRDFIFSPKVGRQVDYPPRGETRQLLPLFSRGTLTIEQMQLGNLEKDQKAHIESMEFRVRIIVGE